MDNPSDDGILTACETHVGRNQARNQANPSKRKRHKYWLGPLSQTLIIAPLQWCGILPHQTPGGLASIFLKERKAK